MHVLGTTDACLPKSAGRATCLPAAPHSLPSLQLFMHASSAISPSSNAVGCAKHA